MTDPLHPRLRAALERDGISLMKLAEVVGLNFRTVSKWGLDDEYGSRAAAFRRLEDVIAGRSRLVKVGRTWELQELSEEGVSPADLEVLRDDLRRWRDETVAALTSQVDRLTAAIDSVTAQVLAPVSESVLREKSDTERLPSDAPVATVGAMNASVLKDVAQSIRSRSKGRMVMFTAKVQPDFKARLDEGARQLGMKPGDVLRALVECQMPAPSEVQE